MKKWVAALAAVLFAVAAWLWFSKANPGSGAPGTTGRSAAEQDAAVEKALAAASPEAARIIVSNFAAPSPQAVFYSAPSKPLIAPAGPPQALEYTNLEPAVVLERLRHTIRDYGAMFDGNPVGENSEITSQLSGQNPKQANFIQPEAGMRVNERGELVDPWGTPYFFHQLSGKRMEIRSAGPDKVLWTADDLVAE